MPKFAEQTDLEDFTNPVIEIKKDFSNKDDLDQKHLQKKPDDILKEFIKKVDDNLYEAKRSGRNKVVCN